MRFGQDELIEIENVKYVNISAEDMLNDNKKYDALIIFAKCYVSFYNPVQYPVFFFGLENTNIFAFLFENVGMDSAYDESAKYIQGFQNSEGGRQSWAISLPNDYS
ncbi:hypothetical protein [Sutcliffiella rhizosphaerae]|uniref:Uncharacterized protein n=1 Tax=Sutcliffiella rhizosphaerae TaxID=2880967 RepID=A0ABM8YRA6_9BACI|nr:hypothetical protein [Sutcliffiella rhizosphaerae]CAG9622474.1 hypothetical protein BACCIP111883_03265 [Sutcliffiella rhizosphaerae]